MCRIILITFYVASLLIPPLLCQNIYSNEWNNLLQKFGNTLNFAQQPSTETTYTSLEEEFDFIIVGAGASGAALANRLSEISSWKILLLEAGNPGNFLTQIPFIAPLFQLTPYNWNFTMERQDNVCLAMEDHICAWPRGKALGGSTLLNYVVYTRGNPIDYNRWFEMGNEGWSYEEVLPYFLKSEKCNLGELCKSRYHNTDGYLSVEHPFKPKLTDTFLEAVAEMGEKIVDHNTPDYMGFSLFQANLNFGRRHSAADAFLYPFINSRRNLKVVTSARVTKILIDPATKAAHGVLFRKRGKTFIVKATKEVILSAGSLSSPQLLMLSGIGPKEHLEELQIPVIHNLPVGQLLYDHPGYIGLSFRLNQTLEPPDKIFDPSELLKWFFQGQGIFTSVGGSVLGYINTGSIPDKNYPDLELIFGVGSLETDYGLIAAKELRLRQEIYDTVYRPLERTPTWSMFAMLLHPQSRGYLKLKSQDPYEPPLFYGNYFTDPDGIDIKTLLAGIRYIQKFSETSAFQKFGSRIHDIPIPGCENFVFDSDDYWFCALRSLSVSFHHQIATCKMGPINDEEAVVDSRLKVHGIKKLRVIDASIMPSTMSGHTSAPSVMIGEKGSDLIKEDWSVKQ